LLTEIEEDNKRREKALKKAKKGERTVTNKNALRRPELRG